MKFRLKAFGWHVAASVGALTLVLGGLFLGWYRWPGWYLSGALAVAPILVGVDVALGPIVTLLIANPAKPRRALARDIAIIAAVQLAALVYGASALWSGRPLYYAYSDGQLHMIQAQDLKPSEVERARRDNPALAPHWYSRPRWVSVPLPEDTAQSIEVVTSALPGGDDITQMPRFYRPWAQGLAELRKHLQTVDAQGARIPPNLKPEIKRRVAALGLKPDQPVTLMMSGRTTPLLAVLDPADLKVRALLRTDR